ncbi:Hypothetical protein R9X50_00049100 [Acrodontium crateriforme]|uniref:Large ribosomal subunit protein eL14 domain-containing protein n=1 Tax=Acrodontium crateriforme TaxID=150365 RepID=A0AAQ3R225_9PEZI|nr:Hypothetical protein R9X50_00049100 [Acrodontium crateriforme]
MGDADVTASNWRNVEVGRIAYFAKGEFAGRLAAIVQIIDHKRVLVDGPSSDAKKAVPRHAAPLSHISLTGLVVKIPFAIGTAALKKRWDAEDIDGQWAKSSYAQGIAKSTRRKQLSDFERFKAMVLRKQARFEVRKQLAAKA